MKFFKIFFAILPLLVVISFSIFVNYKNGFFNTNEATKYLVHYIDEKPLLVKIFDYHGHDTSLYRARDLGNVFNLLDSYAILFFAFLGIPHFLSPVHYLCMFVIVVFPIMYVMKRHHANISLLILAVLLGILYLTSPAPYYTGTYFRTTKSVVAVLLTVFFWLYHLISVKNFRINTLVYSFCVCLLLLSMGIVDEMGIPMSILCLGFLCFAFLRGVERAKQFQLFVGGLAGVVGIFLYRNFLGQRITAAVIGEYPVLWGDGSVSRYDLPFLYKGMEIMLNYMGNLTGEIRGPVLGVLILSVVTILSYVSYIYWKKHAFEVKRYSQLSMLVSTSIPLYSLGVFIFLGIIGGMMAKNHEFVAIQITQVGYYPLPFVTLWFLLISLACFHLIEVQPKLKYGVFLILFIFIGLNIIRLPHYLERIRSLPINVPLYGAAFPIIDAIQAEHIDHGKVETIPGKEVIYLFRKKLGKKAL